MRHPAINCFAFVFLTIGVFFGVNRAAISAGHIFKDGAALICESKRESVRAGKTPPQPGKLNVLFMGNSRILAGIVPAQFDELSGGKTASWNMALPALPVGPAYFLLLDYLEHNPAPSDIVLSLSVNFGNDTGWYDPTGIFSYYANQGMTRMEATSYLALRHDKTVVGNYVFPARMYTEALFKYVRLSILHRQAIAQTAAHNEKIIQQMIDDRGYYFIGEQAIYADNGLPDDFDSSRAVTTLVPIAPPDEINLAKDPYVKLFFDLAQSRHIHVLLMEPAVRAPDDLHLTQCPRHYGQLLVRYGNVSLSELGWRQKVYPNRLFSDPTHLTRAGAKKFTAEIWSEFAQVYRDRFMKTDLSTR